MKVYLSVLQSRRQRLSVFRPNKGRLHLYYEVSNAPLLFIPRRPHRSEYSPHPPAAIFVSRALRWVRPFPGPGSPSTGSPILARQQMDTQGPRAPYYCCPVNPAADLAELFSLIKTLDHLERMHVRCGLVSRRCCVALRMTRFHTAKQKPHDHLRGHYHLHLLSLMFERSLIPVRANRRKISLPSIFPRVPK